MLPRYSRILGFYLQGSKHAQGGDPKRFGDSFNPRAFLQLTPRILWDRLFLTKFYEKKMKNMPLSADIIIDLHKKPKKVYSCKVFMRVTKQQ